MTTLTTCPAPARLHGLLEASLPADREAQIREHLETCPTCRARRDQLAMVEGWLLAPPTPVAPVDGAAFLAAAKARATNVDPVAAPERAAARTAAGRTPSWRTPRVMSGLAAASLLVLVAGLALLAPDRAPVADQPAVPSAAPRTVSAVARSAELLATLEVEVGSAAPMDRWLAALHDHTTPESRRALRRELRRERPGLMGEVPLRLAVGLDLPGATVRVEQALTTLGELPSAGMAELLRTAAWVRPEAALRAARAQVDAGLLPASQAAELLVGARAAEIAEGVYQLGLRAGESSAASARRLLEVPGARVADLLVREWLRAEDPEFDALLATVIADREDLAARLAARRHRLPAERRPALEELLARGGDLVALDRLARSIRTPLTRDPALFGLTRLVQLAPEASVRREAAERLVADLPVVEDLQAWTERPDLAAYRRALADLGVALVAAAPDVTEMRTGALRRWLLAFGAARQLPEALVARGLGDRRLARATIVACGLSGGAEHAAALSALLPEARGTDLRLLTEALARATSPVAMRGLTEAVGRRLARGRVLDAIAAAPSPRHLPVLSALLTHRDSAPRARAVLIGLGGELLL